MADNLKVVWALYSISS